MYRTGLGDCFLLKICEQAGSDVKYVLIDCGVFIATKGGADRIRRIVHAIADETNGKIDLLILTHEHWDHLSGFIYADEIVDERLHFENVWLGWTDNPRNDVANQLRRQRRVAAMGLRGMTQSLRLNSSASDEKRIENLEKMLQFEDPVTDADSESVEKLKRKNTGDVINWARDMEPEYWEPGGEPKPLPGCEKLRAYILGPPTDLKLLKKSDPTPSDPEVYDILGITSEQETAFYAAAVRAGMLSVDHLSPPDETIHVEQEQRAKEIETALRRAESTARPFLSGAEGLGEHPLDETLKCNRLPENKSHGLDLYKLDEARSLEFDWLGESEKLALKLNSDTNNTSLAIAIELLDSGKVLLFPGDAQVGNWLGWHEKEWTVIDNGRARKVTAQELLERTVFYKVGHHASHNATLREKGLEMMTSNELVAMIPVDEEFARNRFDWEMPFNSLYEELNRKTQGRVIRSDLFIRKSAPNGASQSTWNAFRQRVWPSDDTIDDNVLYFSYTIDFD